MIIYYSVIVFVTQLVFILFRTLNVMAIADKNIPRVLITGALVHISWLVGIAIGAVSMYEIIGNFNWQYVPVVVCSLAGGLIGSYIALVTKK